MLITTHQALLKSLRDVHAAQLQTETLKLAQLTEKLEVAKEYCENFRTQLKASSELIHSQQKTISMAMSDLVILKGAGRIRSEQDKPPEPQELRPDVEITDQPADIPDRRKLIKDAEAEYERAIAALEREVDTSQVTPEAVAAAVPESLEAWKEEHAQPSDSHLNPVVRV
jgi:predicted ribosome quality control (RQC) complex YloA/Tae2 family protein